MNDLGVILGGITDEVEKIGEEYGVSSLGVDRLIAEIVSILEGRGGELISFLLLLISLAVLTRLSELLPERVMRIAEGGVGIIVSYLLFSKIYPLLTEIAGIIGDMTDLFSLVMPIVITFITVSGGITLAPASSVIMQITLYVMSVFSSEVLVKVVLVILALSAISGAERGISSRIARGVKNTFTRLIGFMGTALSLFVGLQTYITAAKDGATLRLARMTASDIIPMVGSVVSGALGTVMGGIQYVGTLLGVTSVVALLSVSLSPLVILLGYRLAFFVCEFLLDFSGTNGGVLIFSGFRGALDALISVYVMTMIVYILEIVILVMGGASLVG